MFYGRGLFVDFNTEFLVIGIGGFAAGFALAAILHNKVQDHYDKLRT